MPKEIVDNRIFNYTNRDGRILQHDIWLDQSVKSTSNPTFSNLRITGDTTLEGNLYVEGSTTVLSTTVIEFQDNVILLNDKETGSGITLNQGGIEIDRGILENVRLVWDELYGTFRVGVISVMSSVALREDVPLSSGVMIWNSLTGRIDSRDSMDIPMRFLSTVDSTSSTLGGLIISGGVGIKKDMFIDGKISIKDSSVLWTDTSDSFNISSIGRINLMPSESIVLPFNIPFVFGSVSQGILSDSGTSDLRLYSGGDIRLTPSLNKSIKVPNQIPIIFSTQNEKVYTDNNNNMVIESSQDIILKPANGNGNKSIKIPLDTPLVFNNNNQQIVSNSINDLSINAGNNILLNPGQNLYVRIPTDNGLKFGGSGNQVISSNSSNELKIISSGDIYLSPSINSNVNIPSNVKLTFGATQNILSDTNGNLEFNSLNGLNVKSILQVSNTNNSSSASNGSINTSGGLGVRKDIICESRVLINSIIDDSLNVSMGKLKVDGSNSGKVSILAGDGTINNPSLELSSTNSLNSENLIHLSTVSDNTLGYMIGRNSRALSINIPSYSAYNETGMLPLFNITSNNQTLFSVESDSGNIFTLGTFGLGNTSDATSPTTAAVIISGGLGVVKSIYTSGKYNSVVNDVEALSIKNTMNETIFNVNTLSKLVNVSGNLSITTENNTAFSITDTFNVDTLQKVITDSCIHISTNELDSTGISNGSYIISGGMGIIKTLNVGGVVNLFDGANVQNNCIINLKNPIMPQDAATKSYVDLIKQGLFVKDSVKVATVGPNVLATDFTPGSMIDNYMLVIGNRVLIKNQDNGVENGIYIITSGVPERTLDLQIGYHAVGTFAFVEYGSINSNLGWICNSPDYNDIVGSSVLNYTQFTGLGQITEGNGLTKTFNTLDVNVDNYSIEIVSDVLRLSNNNIGTGLTGGSGSPLQTISDQSHVTKLGTINTGVWNGNSINVPYGGTGKTTIAAGNILFGNGINPIEVDSQLFFNKSLTRLGLGTNNPQSQFHIASTNTITLQLGSDSDANNLNAKPEILFSYNGGSKSSIIGMTRNNNEYASGIYSDALVISNNQTDNTSCIQLATNLQSRMTILSNGNIGINTSNPGYNLDIKGSFNTSGLVTFNNTKSSTNSSDASLIINGGMSIKCNINSQNIYNGGALTVNGGTSILKDLYVGGEIKGSPTSMLIFPYIKLTATDESINISSGSLLSLGGITIQCSTDATSYTNGGSLLTIGGASIGASLFVGNTLNVYRDAYINSIYFTSNSISNFIESPNNTLDNGSFIPINYTQYNNTESNILTIHNNGIVLNRDASIQIGGDLDNIDGYNICFKSQNLNILPNNNNNNSINIGTVGSLSNINIYGINAGRISWQSTLSNLLLTNSDITLNNNNNITNSLIISTPNTNGNTLIKANNSDMTINFGKDSIGGQLSTILSNNIGDSTITFTPSNITNSTLILTNNIYSVFNGPISSLDRIEYSGNALHQTINNNTSTPLWTYFGKINTTIDGINERGYTEIDIICGSNYINGNDLTGIKIQASINGTNCSTSHQHYGNILHDSTNKPICYIYKENNNTNYHLFIRSTPYSQSNINISINNGDKFVLQNEGIDTTPNGSISTFNINWDLILTTQIQSTLKYTTGDLTIEGQNLNIADNLPIIGYNNNLTINSRDLGIAYQRYQIENDYGTGDIVNDTPYLTDSIPNQSTSLPNQIKLSTLTSLVDNYYKGWWIKIFTGSNLNQVRKIISYNGAQHIATLETPFTNQNPSAGDTILFFNFSYIVNYYDEINDTFSLSYTHSPPGANNVDNIGNADLRIKHLYLTDTTISSNASTGSIHTLGGIAISNTNDAVSSTFGSTFTTLGGMSVKKNILIGNNIGIGSSGFVPSESLHIKKNTNDNIVNSTIRLENELYSYIDFVEESSSNRYGILLDSPNNLFSLTSTNSNTTPQNSNKALTINILGYIGINTTSNIISPITIKANNFISINNTIGYLGLVGAATNTNDNSLASRINIESNSLGGSIKLYAGSNNVSLYSNNDIEGLRLDKNGIVNIFSTQPTKSSTSGSLIISGGLSIKATENANSISSGGALLVQGGASINKDLYLGGNLYITGSLNASGSVTSPDVTFSNFNNCTMNEYYNNNLVTISTTAILSFAVSVFCNAPDINTELHFSLPGRTNAFAKRGDVILSISGYTDDNDVIIINNLISVGIVGTGTSLIKFQSVNTGLHYFQIQATYTLA